MLIIRRGNEGRRYRRRRRGAEDILAEKKPKMSAQPKKDAETKQLYSSYVSK
jgi:hypothetical protein